MLGLPCFEPGVAKSEMANSVQVVIEELKDSPYEVTAWFFPPEYLLKPSCLYKDKDGEGKFYFGTFVVIKRV